MWCSQCGNELPEGARFCTNCGAEVRQYEEADLSYDRVDITDSQMEYEAEQFYEEEEKKNSDPISDLKAKWNDKYTIIAIVGILVVAALGGIIVKKVTSGREESAKSGYVSDMAAQEDLSADEEDMDKELLAEEAEAERQKEEQEKAEREKAEKEKAEKEKAEKEKAEKEKAEKEKAEAKAKQDYILPDSSTRYLSKADLNGLTADQCRIARNEIYARHGRMFKDEGLQAYFNAFEWYHPSIHPDDFQESMLNAYEVANRDLIVEYESEHGYR